eukprot:TRINITY_DN76080_c0_g1_i1.p1 TRINITY_DN76080_c0_g1~~TRINITY_DN76080_c0_g1_i1.p1  ORF type:complete len:182 (+),score=42.17 TRINITY_DN76080_c0_g1_i1:70-615(+)
MFAVDNGVRYDKVPREQRVVAAGKATHSGSKDEADRVQLTDAAADRDEWQTLHQATYQQKPLERATKKMSHPSRRPFNRRLALPADELAVLSQRRQAQEKEWRRILRRQHGLPSCSTRTGLTASAAETGSLASSSYVPASSCGGSAINAAAIIAGLLPPPGREARTPRTPRLPAGMESAVA